MRKEFVKLANRLALFAVMLLTANESRGEVRGYLHLNLDETGEAVSASFEGDAEWLVAQEDERSHLHKLSRLRRLTLNSHEISAEELRYVAALKNVTSLTIGLLPGEATVSGTALAELEKMTWLESLEICASDLESKDWAFLQRLKALKHLQICSDAGLTDEVLRYIGQCQQLEVFELSGDFSDEGLQQVSNLRELRTLLIGSPRFGDRGLRAIATLEKLTDLTIAAPQSTSQGVRSLVLIPSLRKLDLQFDIDEKSLTAIASSERLKEVVVRLPRATEADLRKLANMTSLRRLSLHSELDTEAVRGLEPLDLRSLTLNIQKADVETMKIITSFGRLESLDLQQAEVGDDELALLAGHRALKSLYLNNAKVTTNSLPVLKSMTNLEIVSLRGDEAARAVENEINDFLQSRRTSCTSASGVTSTECRSK